MTTLNITTEWSEKNSNYLVFNITTSDGEQYSLGDDELFMSLVKGFVRLKMVDQPGEHLQKIINNAIPLILSKIESKFVSQQEAWLEYKENEESKTNWFNENIIGAIEEFISKNKTFKVQCRRLHWCDTLFLKKEPATYSDDPLGAMKSVESFGSFYSAASAEDDPQTPHKQLSVWDIFQNTTMKVSESAVSFFSPVSRKHQTKVTQPSPTLPNS